MKTSRKKQIAGAIFFLMTPFFSIAQSPCIDTSLIDSSVGCYTVYDPVCGCDSVTYGNDCEAYYHNGVTSWASGICSLTGIISSGDLEADVVVFPNPAVHQVYVEVTLPKQSDLTIIVYDNLAREKGRLLSQYNTNGKHKVMWDITSIEAGMYIIVVSTGEERVIRPVQIIH